MVTNNPKPTSKDIVANTREELGLSLRAYAVLLGVSHQAVAQWEAGTSAPDEKRLTAWMHSDTYWIRELSVKLMALRKWDVMVLMVRR